MLVVLLETAVLVEDKESAQVFAAPRLPVAHLAVTGAYTDTCPARQLGAAVALLGEPDNTRAYYHQALEVCAKIGFRPEIALIRL